MATTLEDLLQTRTRATIEALLMASLQEATIEGTTERFPVTDWAPGSFERTTLKMIATGLVDREDVIPMLTAGGFLGLAQSITDAEGNLVEGWMELLAARNYALDRIEAVFAIQLLTLTCTAGPGPYTRAAGEIVAFSPSTGNRYRNVSSVTIPDSGSVTAQFKAESPGLGYNDAAGSIIAMVTPMPGVSVINAPTPAGVPANFITGTGTIAVTSTAISTSLRTVKLTFTASGRIDDGSAKMTCTVYTGAGTTVTGPSTVNATFTQGDLALALADGTAGTQSFNAGDEWIVGVPGTPLLQAGAEKEPLDSLAARCSNRWPALADVPTVGRFESWVMDCSHSSSLGITKVKSSPSLTVAGIEDILIAGATATATPAQVAAVQGHLDVRLSQIEGAAVAAAEARPITMSGQVKCKRGTTSAVQAASDLAWERYLALLPIGGSDPGGLVILAELEQCLMDAGAYNVSGLTLNGISGDVALTKVQCATIASNGTPMLALTWQEVS